MMNRWIHWGVAAGLVLLLAGAAPTPAAPRYYRHYRYSAAQPNMRTALSHLRSARVDLRRGTPDKGGHRARAIRLIDQAIAEVERGIRFDNTH